MRGCKSFFTSSRLHLLPLGIGAVEAREVFVCDPFLPGSPSGPPCPSSTDGPAKKVWRRTVRIFHPRPLPIPQTPPPSSFLPSSPFHVPPRFLLSSQWRSSIPPPFSPHIAGSRRKRELRLSSSMPAADGDTFCAGGGKRGGKGGEKHLPITPDGGKILQCQKKDDLARSFLS